MTRLLSVLTILALATLAWAGDGYTSKNGYWYKSGRYYNKYRVTNYVPQYSSCGTCTSYAPSYSYYYEEADYTPAVDTESPDAVSRILEIAKYRDQALLKERGRMATHNASLELIDKLGLGGNFHVDGYAPAVGYPLIARPFAASGYGNGYRSAFLGNYGASGNTLAGYSYSTAVDAYGQVDLNALFQQSAQLTRNAQTLAGQAQGDFSDRIGQVGNQFAAAAEIRAKGQAAAAALAAVQATPQTRIETRQFTFGAMPGVPPAVGPQQYVPSSAPYPVGPATQGSSRWAEATAACIGCHGGANRRGNYDAAMFEYYAPELQAKVLDRLTTTDEARRMPRLDDGTPTGRPGPRLSDELIREYILRMKQVRP